jgi:hypothetical protein
VSTADDLPPPTTPDNMKPLARPVLLKRLTIWGLFLALMHLARDLFFVALHDVHVLLRGSGCGRMGHEESVVGSGAAPPAHLGYICFWPGDSGPSHAFSCWDPRGSIRLSEGSEAGYPGGRQENCKVGVWSIFRTTGNESIEPASAENMDLTPFVLDFAVLLRGRWNCCDLILFELY